MAVKSKIKRYLNLMERLISSVSGGIVILSVSIAEDHSGDIFPSIGIFFCLSVSSNICFNGVFLLFHKFVPSIQLRTINSRNWFLSFHRIV